MSYTAKLLYTSNIPYWTSLNLGSFLKPEKRMAHCMFCGFSCPHTLERHLIYGRGKDKQIVCCSFCHFYRNPVRAVTAGRALLTYCPELTPGECNDLLRVSYFFKDAAASPNILKEAACLFLDLMNSRVSLHQEVFGTSDVISVGEGLSILNKAARAAALKNINKYSRLLFKNCLIHGSRDWWPVMVNEWVKMATGHNGPISLNEHLIEKHFESAFNKMSESGV